MPEKAQVTGPAPTQLPTPAQGAAAAPVAVRLPGDVTDHQRAVAMTWVARGYAVVPCSREAKRGLVPGFGADKTDQELAKFSDPEQVRAWWSGRYKRAHVGLLTGRGVDGRGLVVVDLDMPKEDTEPPAGRWSGCHGGADVLELLAAEAGAEWPETYTVLTPSGGMHLYFLQPTDGPLIGCATGDGTTPPHIGPMVDVRGIGGYVIAAGSYSAAQGRMYERVSAPDVRPQPLPKWLLALLRPATSSPPSPTARATPPPSARVLPAGTRAERYAAAALNGTAADVADAPEGERNRRLFAAARRLGELAPTTPAVLDETTVREQLLAAALRSGQSEREALRTIRSGWERGLTGAGHGAGAA